MTDTNKKAVQSRRANRLRASGSLYMTVSEYTLILHIVHSGGTAKPH